MNPFKEFTASRMVTPAKPSHHRKAFFLGELGGFHDRTQTGGIGRHGLFQKYMHPRIHRRLEMLWAKTRRRGQDRQVDSAIEHLTV